MKDIGITIAKNLDIKSDEWYSWYICKNPNNMSHTRVKTTYEIEGVWGNTETKELYCHHNHSCDCVTFYDRNGEVVSMSFCSFSTGNDLWDAMERLWFPFKEEWGKELKDNVEYYFKNPWDEMATI